MSLLPRPLSTVQASCEAHGSSKPLSLKVAGSGCERAVGALALWFASRVRLLSPRLASNLSRNEQPSQRAESGSPDPRQHPFRLGITLSSRLWVPAAFRLLAFASWIILFPLGTSAVLTSGLLTGVRPHWGSHVPHYRAATGVGAFYTPGSWCPCSGACVNPWPLPLTVADLPADPALPSCSIIVSGNFKLRSLHEDSLAFTRPVFPLPRPR